MKTKINNTLRDLKQKQLFTEHEYKTLYSTTAATPLFYGLIKTHKENFPIRPIVSFVNSPSYNLAQHLSKVLTPITNLADQKLKNTYEAKEKLSNHSIPDYYELVSFDVQKLFTSIPHDLALNCLSIAIDEHEEKLFDTTRLQKSELIQLVKLCLSATTFKFNGVLYKQISGLPMGSPISVVLSEIVMQHIET